MVWLRIGVDSVKKLKLVSEMQREKKVHNMQQNDKRLAHNSTKRIRKKGYAKEIIQGQTWIFKEIH